MPEKTTPEKEAEETARRYMREAETTTRDTVRMMNDLLSTTINFTFDMFGKTLHHGMEMTRYTEDAFENMTNMYRRMYTDGMKAWEGYWDDVTKTVMPKK